MRTRNQPDTWTAIEEDLKRLESEEPLEPEESGERVPCEDESCLGTLGQDGRCRLCGWAPRSSPASETGLEGLEEEPEGWAEEDLQEEMELEQQERVCCSDESCVGIVDEEGYCRICGLKWKEGGYLEGETLLYRGDSIS